MTMGPNQGQLSSMCELTIWSLMSYFLDLKKNGSHVPNLVSLFKKNISGKKMAAVQYSFKYVAVSKDVKSGQMESYFTNMDLPEIRGDFPKPQLLEEIGCFFRSRATLTRNILVTWIWVRPASVRCARLTASGCSGPLEVYPQGFPRFRQNKKGSKIQSFGTKLNACVPWLGSISYKNCINYIIQFQCANTSLEDRSLCSKSGDRGNVLVGTLLTSTCRPSLFYGRGQLLVSLQGSHSRPWRKSTS